MSNILLFGDHLSIAFQEAKHIIEDIREGIDPSLKLFIHSFPPIDWLLNAPRLHYAFRGNGVWGDRLIDKQQPLLIVHSKFGCIGGVDELVAWACEHYGKEFTDPRNLSSYSLVKTEYYDAALNEFFHYIEESQTPSSSSGDYSSFVYIDFHIDGSASFSSEISSFIDSPSIPKNRIIIQLYSSQLPKTCENFRLLCTGEVPLSNAAKNAGISSFSYKNTVLHRIVTDGWIQGGDIGKGGGDMGWSAIGGGEKQYFEDENLSIMFDEPYSIAMANYYGSMHTNSSQFFITLRPLPALNGKKVLFGRVLAGHSLLHYFNTIPTENQRPLSTITIASSGIFSSDLLNREPGFNDRKREREENKKAEETEKKQQAEKQLKLKRKTLLLSNAINLENYKITLLIMGIDGVGKNSIINYYQGNSSASTSPTLGFENHRFESIYPSLKKPKARIDLTLFNIGGAANLRGIVSDYFDGVFGIIFVYDASENNEERNQQQKEEFEKMIQHPYITGKPIVIYCNKQDIVASGDTPAPMGVSEVALRLGVDQYIKRGEKIYLLKCSTKDHTPSIIIEGSETGIDDHQSSISRGLSWIEEQIIADYSSMNTRVNRDIAAVKARQRKIYEEKLAQIKKEREEGKR